MKRIEKATNCILFTKEKGGVGTTTSATNLAYDLAQRGHNVLLVDMDTRGDCAACFNLDPAPDLETVIEHGLRTGEVYVDIGAFVARENLAIVRTNMSGTLAAMEMANGLPLNGAANLLADLGAGYDYVIFDTSAASGVLRKAAMQIVDLMVIPTKLEALGMPDIAALIEAYGKPEQVLILPVMAENLNVHLYNLGVLIDAYDDAADGGCVADPIPKRVAVVESHQAMKPVMEYAPKNDASVAYRDFTEVVLAKLGQSEAEGDDDHNPYLLTGAELERAEAAAKQGVLKLEEVGDDA